MNLRKVIQEFFWLICFVLFGQNASSQELKLIGSADVGILPEDASKVCKSIGGSIAMLTDENRQFITDLLLKKCDSKSNFCPKVCLWRDRSDKNDQMLQYENIDDTMMTPAIYPGDIFHLKVKIEQNTLEVFQLSDSILETISDGEIQDVLMQLNLYNNFFNTMDHITISKKITMESGHIRKEGKGLVNSMSLKELTPIKNVDGILELTLEFTKEQKMNIRLLHSLGENNFTGDTVGNLNGRMYFKKFYEKSVLLDSYFTRGNCSRLEFHHYPKDNTNGFVDCLWMQKASIPLYSCRKASYVACENVSFPTTTDSPLTSKNHVANLTKVHGNTRTSGKPTTITTTLPGITYLPYEFLGVEDQTSFHNKIIHFRGSHNAFHIAFWIVCDVARWLDHSSNYENVAEFKF